MQCPYCYHAETKVNDTREPTISTTRRRRECLKCKKRFTTYERVESIDLVIVKKDGRREQFNRNKLLRGIVSACQKRPIPRERIEKLVDEIETELRNKDGIEINSKDIGELVIRKLEELDKVAYIRFASVYREFNNLKSFEKELRKIGEVKE
ncbi:MAG: transcriptional regulator NrdR [Candidatus Woesearchaeota archaeon]|jgi:transcriptional repressor NrdR|nr:transcriptional regulator NrdR [Candidatus Woesearchaeota archaeon]|tara:strand:+ start:300 stop:755 length:456 start_codon:yes stop_codon:yes gene_type:complete